MSHTTHCNNALQRHTASAHCTTAAASYVSHPRANALLLGCAVAVCCCTVLQLCVGAVLLQRCCCVLLLLQCTSAVCCCSVVAVCFCSALVQCVGAVCWCSVLLQCCCSVLQWPAPQHCSSLTSSWYHTLRYLNITRTLWSKQNSQQNFSNVLVGLTDNNVVSSARMSSAGM